MEHYIGIDLHKAFFQACAVTSVGERNWEDRFARTSMGIKEFLGRVPRPCCAGVEASGPTWAFADAISEGVDEVVIVDAAKTRLRAGYAAKTDRLDARRLADALRRSSVVTVYYPTKQIREMRELCRYRMTLSRTAVTLKQRIHALLLRQGVEMPETTDLFGRTGSAWLKSVRIERRAEEGLRGLCSLLASVDKQLQKVDQQVEVESSRDAVVRALDEIPGIGPILSLTLRAEIGCIDRFPDGAHLASYAGLVPYVSQSAKTCRHGRITKRGSPYLRWALVEAAVHAVGRDDNYGRIARRLAMRKGILKARVASARLLCDEVIKVWRKAVQVLSASGADRFLTSDWSFCE